MLLEFLEIQRRLEKQFEDTPEDFKSGCVDLRLNTSNLSSEMLNEVEARLEIRLPTSFREIILQYDFGNLTLGGIWFGRDQNYDQFLIESNADEQQNLLWWGSGRRPSNYLLVANSHGYLILLNTNTGEVLAYLRSQFWEEFKIVASSFDVFSRAAATVFLQTRKEDEFSANLSRAVGCSDNCSFWREIIDGIA